MPCIVQEDLSTEEKRMVILFWRFQEATGLKVFSSNQNLKLKRFVSHLKLISEMIRIPKKMMKNSTTMTNWKKMMM